VTELAHPTPAEVAAEKALSLLYGCLNSHRSFRFEAGAGAGKTHSLVKALEYLIHGEGSRLQRRQQQIACITYTNVASDEISSRMRGHPAIWSSTIHAFCWFLIRSFQPRLRMELSGLTRWKKRLEEAGGISNRAIAYDLGYPTIDASTNLALLGHADVLTLFASLLHEVKFRKLVLSRFPFLFLDEYQDTNKNVAESLVENLINRDEKIVLGFFGDHWQKIYGEGCGLIESDRLVPIQKEANFRSAKEVVGLLNRMRPSLPQAVNDLVRLGSIVVYHSNEWKGSRLSGAQWDGDLPREVAHGCLEWTLRKLESHGWEVTERKLKILMLTHNVLANEQGYGKVAEVFQGRTEAFVRKEDPHIKFFVEVVEPSCEAFNEKRFGRMFEVLGGTVPRIASVSDKTSWQADMSRLNELRETATVGEVIDFLKRSRRPRLSERVERAEQRLDQWVSGADSEPSNATKRLKELRDIPHREISALAKFVDERTPFATKHGVKGEEYENVIVVVGRGWNQYNFSDFLEWSGAGGVPANKRDAYERNRNLFYVACSRAKTRLALLFTQQLSIGAMSTLSEWFGSEYVHPVQFPHTS
jgi:DNA helicase-2/ATP-dependent DNA helicase PcrA